MLIHAAEPIFAWAELEDVPQPRTTKEALCSPPDQRLLEGLQAARGNGRDDYPPSVLWGVVLLSILCRHLHVEDCPDELQRNPTLCALIGINSPVASPRSGTSRASWTSWGRSRTCETAGPSSTPWSSAWARPCPAWAGTPPATAPRLRAAPGRTPRRSPRRRNRDCHSRPAQGVQGRGGQATKVYERFGYKLHLLVDVDSEVSLAYAISDTRTGDNELIDALAEQARANLPQGRVETLAHGKAADGGKARQALHDRGIEPVIPIRATWKGEKEEVVRAGPPMVYDEAGTVYCYDTTGEQPIERKMTYVGHEKDRGTARYRCPAVYEGFVCGSAEKCNGGEEQGLSVRIKCEEDLRRFPAIPRGTRQFEERYKGRTAVERVNARSKIFWGVDDGNVVGSRRFHGYVGAVMVIHAAVAVWLAAQPRWEGTLGDTRPGPIAQALARLDESDGTHADVT